MVIGVSVERYEHENDHNGGWHIKWTGMERQIWTDRSEGPKDILILKTKLHVFFLRKVLQ